MRVSSGRGGDGHCGDPTHQIVHQKATDDHSGEFGLSPCLCNVHGGEKYDGDHPDGALVRSRRVK